MDTKQRVNTTPLIIALNKTWQAIQRNHPELGNAMITTGRRRNKNEANRRGEHCKDTWKLDGIEDKAPEIVIYGERLAEGAEAVLQTLIHEAAHELANLRKLKDTSNRGRYHNRTFVKIAEEMGLEGPASSAGPSMGYSDCHITRDTIETYDYEVKELAEACKSFVSPTMVEEKKVKKETIYAYCQCDDDGSKVTWTKKLQNRYEELGGLYPLMCAVCRQTFVPEGEDREN